MISTLNNKRFKRTLLAATITMFVSGCLHDDNDDDTTPPAGNTAPAITSTSVVASTEGTAYAYTLVATDADGDALTMTAPTLPAWLAFDAASGALTGTPATADVGDHAVTLTVSDGTDSVNQTFTITVAAVVVANTAPSVTSTSVNAATEGTAYSYMFAATDADGDALTMSAPTLPSWLTFNASTGMLTGTPATANVGDSAVVLSVTDGTDTVTQSFTITVAAVVVANTAPEITSTGTTTGTVGAAYTYTLTATDADGDSLSMSSVVVPAWAAFDTATGILSGTPDAVGDFDVELMVSDGTDADTQTFTIAVAAASSSEVVMTVFENTAVPEWAAWDCCGGTTPAIVTDDVDHDQATEFTIVNGGDGGTVVGFIARDSEGAVGGMPFDATGGKISFDLKLTQQATGGATGWLLKVESNASAGQFAEVALSTSNEAHAAPVLDVWQTYTFDISAFSATTLDETAVDVVMVFPAWGTGEGAKFLLDNVKITSNSVDGGGDTTPGPELLTNGDFENAATAWTGADNSIVTDGSNSYFEVDVVTAGEVFSVNLSQTMTLIPDTDYVVTFKAKGSVARTMIAGLGLFHDPWTNVAESVALTTEWQTFTLNINTTGFGDDNSRVLFDMGGETGVVSIDDVSVSLSTATGGGDTGGGDTGGGDTGGTLAPVTFEAGEAGAAYTWAVFENDDNPGLEIVANPDASGANTSTTVAKFTARVTGNPWAGTETAHGDFGPMTIDSSNSIIKIMVYKTVISDVGIKFAIASGGAQPEIKVANTQVNQWEELTFDFSGNIGLVESINIDQLIIFPDFDLGGRSADTVSYFDNVTFGSN